MRGKFKYIVASLVITTLTAILWPWESVIIESVSLRFVNNEGFPIKGIKVERESEYCLVKSSFISEEKISDDNGEVYFEGKTVTANMAQRVLGFMKVMFRAAFHGSYGYVNIFDIDELSYKDWFYIPNDTQRLKPTNLEVILEKKQ